MLLGFWKSLNVVEISCGVSSIFHCIKISMHTFWNRKSENELMYKLLTYTRVSTMITSYTIKIYFLRFLYFIALSRRKLNWIKNYPSLQWLLSTFGRCLPLSLVFLLILFIFIAFIHLIYFLVFLTSWHSSFLRFLDANAITHNDFEDETLTCKR